MTDKIPDAVIRSAAQAAFNELPAEAIVDRHDLEPCMRAALKAAEAMGWVLVPVEATFDQSQEGQLQVNLSEKAGEYEYLSIDEVDSVYRAMLAARPKVE